MRTIAVLTQKGGTGKTTTSAALCAGLTRRGKRALAIDLDPQGNLSFIMRADAQRPTVKEIMERKATTAQAIQETPAGDIIASSPALASADKELTATGKEYRLREALEGIAGQYDYCVIDCPPSLGILTVNALTAADGALIPSQPDALSLQGVGALFETIRAVKTYCNPSLQVNGILLTRYSSRALINRDGERKTEAAAAQHGTKVYKTRIRETVSLREAQTMRQDIFSYAPRSNGAVDYNALVDEIEMEG